MICKPKSRIYYEETLCFHRCCRCFGKAKTHDDADYEESYAKLLSGKYEDYLVDDGKTVICCYHRPVRVGANILCYGKRASYWPWQCLIGPDWPCSMFTYIAIIGVHAFVLGVTSIHLGWPVLMLGLMGGCGLLYVYSMVACSNPGMVLKHISEISERNDTIETENGNGNGNGNDTIEDTVGNSVSGSNSLVVDLSSADIESGSISTSTDNNVTTTGVELSNRVTPTRSNDSDSGSSEGAGTRQLLPSKAKPSAANNTNTNTNTNGVVDLEKGGNVKGVVQRAGSVPPSTRSDTIPCGQCKIDRPRTARHCPYCGACINDLDHHCPWSGRCIGENNIRAFHIFVGWLCFEIYFMLGIFIYFCISYWADRSLDAGAKY
jgi:hypothetical protein